MSLSKEIIQCADLKHYNFDQMNRIYSPEGVCPTIMTVTGGGRQVKIKDGDRIRYITPKECFRLMGFDDKDVDILIENNFSKTQLYKMAGNSIVVNVLESIFKELINQEYLDK